VHQELSRPKEGLHHVINVNKARGTTEMHPLHAFFAHQENILQFVVQFKARPASTAHNNPSHIMAPNQFLTAFAFLALPVKYCQHCPNAHLVLLVSTRLLLGI
jgi:hypothetical protein